MQYTHPLKVFRFCPKCGSAEFHRSGERSLKCAGCGFHFYFNSSAAVAALVQNTEGKLMLVKRGVEPHYGKLDLPGGFVDPGETAEHAIRRELSEELGLEVESLEYMGSAPNEYIYSDFSVFTLDFAFRVTPKSIKNLKPMDDILDFEFYAKDEINYDEIPADSIQYFVRQYFKK
jgi:mutator protein MutT